MLWQIEKMPSGNFKIKSKLQIPGSAQELVMAVSWSGTNQSADGLQIKALLYSDDNYNTDEWSLAQMYRPIKVIHYYDEGIANRFENVSEDITNFQELISAYMLENFNIPLPYEVHQYTSISDVEPYRVFDPGDIKEDVVERFGGGNIVTIPVIWTSAILTESRGHYDLPPENECIFIPIDVSKTGNFNNIESFDAIDCLCHELSHKLGLRDHYCTCSLHKTVLDAEEHGCESCENRYCSIHVYGEDVPHCMMDTMGNENVELMLEQSVPVEDIYCASCIAELSKISRVGVWQ